jgi:hypothetical protein
MVWSLAVASMVMAAGTGTGAGAGEGEGPGVGCCVCTRKLCAEEEPPCAASRRASWFLPLLQGPLALLARVRRLPTRPGRVLCVVSITAPSAEPVGVTVQEAVATSALAAMPTREPAGRPESLYVRYWAGKLTERKETPGAPFSAAIRVNLKSSLPASTPSKEAT